MTDLLSVDWSAIPKPIDDGAARHLPGTSLPSLDLRASNGRVVNLAQLLGTTVVYVFPKIGQPGQPLPDGWNATPGARGCTPQSCAFRDLSAELKALGVDTLFGLSSQDRDYQSEAANRLHLPFLLLSDDDFKFTQSLQLPTFEFSGVPLLKRLTLVIIEGRIEHVFYPVFPPDQNPREILEWLQLQTQIVTP